MMLILAAMGDLEPIERPPDEPAALATGPPSPRSDVARALPAGLLSPEPLAFPVHPSGEDEPRAWADGRFALGLHPVGWHYGVRYQELLRATMGGRGAPSTFGPTVAEADVYWRFEATAPGFVQLPEDAPARWCDVAMAGSLLATDRLVDETIRRAPQLQAFRASLDALVNPNLQVRAGDGRPVRLEHVTGGRQQRAIDRQEAETAEDDGAFPGHSGEATAPPGRALPAAPVRGPRAPEPRVGVGVDWQLRDEDAPPHAPLLGYGVWVDASNVGISAVHADVSVLTGEWSVTARQRVYPRVFVYGRAAGVGPTAPPERYAGGVMWALSGSGNWTLRAERSVDAAPDPHGRGPSVRTTLTLRSERHTPIPAREGEPFGDGGLCFPALPERAPNDLGPLTTPSYDAWHPASCDRHD